MILHKHIYASNRVVNCDCDTFSENSLVSSKHVTYYNIYGYVPNYVLLVLFTYLLLNFKCFNFYLTLKYVLIIDFFNLE